MHPSITDCVPPLLGLFVLLVSNMSECQPITIQPDGGTTVTVATSLPMMQCSVCKVKGQGDEPTCNSSLTIFPNENATLSFTVANCSEPQHAFSVEIRQRIECTKSACSPAEGKVQPSIFPGFNRTFIWELSAPKKTVLGLAFSGDGLKERAESEVCQDGYHYSVTRAGSDGLVQTQWYCRSGPVLHLDLPSQATVSLRASLEQQLEPGVFTVTAKPMAKPKKGRMIAVTPDADTTVILSRASEGPDCSVCVGEGATQNCSTELTLRKPQNATIEFSCSQPQNLYTVETTRRIECTKDTCSPATGETQPSVFPGFNRTYIWNLSAPEGTVLGLAFSGDGLKERAESEVCQDGYHYSVTRAGSDGQVQTQWYCRSGPVLHLDLPSQATVSLRASLEQQLEPGVFTVTAKPMAKKGRTMVVNPDPDTIVTFSRAPEGPDCSVCVGEGATKSCSTEPTLREPRNTTVEFSCSQPEDVYTVDVNREIDCTETTCNREAVHPESSLFPEFNRTFTWDLKVPPTRAFQLDFPAPGMRQIQPSERCPDQHTYTIITYQRSGRATIGTFCQRGTISRVQVLYKGRVKLEIPREITITPSNFKVSVGPETKLLAAVKAKLPRGQSFTDFFSANYPSGFPSDDQMRWDFTVLPMHNFTVLFLGNTEPQCRQKEVAVEYNQGGKPPVRKTLADPQLANKQGDFNLSLSNCETDRGGSPGLSLNFRVSVFRSGYPHVCSVDLQGEDGLSLHIENKNPRSYCELRMDSVVQEKITVLPGTKSSLSFLDCPSEELLLTVSKTIECHSWSSCSVSGVLLTVPTLAACLPAPLHQVTWHLHVPEDGTVDLRAPRGNLRQSLPGQECDGPVSLHVSEDNGAPVGRFCAKGAIRKVQIHDNVTITATAKGDKDLGKERGSFFNVSFSPEIAESIIYTVSPTPGAPALLATPNWPGGMKPFSTASWIVQLPAGYRADLLFANISQPKCGQRHTGIKVQKLGSLEEMLSRREDEEAEDKLSVAESFYLNMSNCQPDEGHFSVLSKVTLQKKSNMLLSIILGTVGALLVLMIIVLAVVCVVIRKKKRQMANTSSIYIPKGNIFLPGDASFPKSRADNESHVYASIDEAMVYGHLLGDSRHSGSEPGQFNGHQVDTYRTFTGPMDGIPAIMETPADLEPGSELELDSLRPFLDPSETFIPSRPRTPLGPQESLGFEDRRMVDNVFNTFKSFGEPNPIRLSAIEPEPEPELASESEYDNAM